MPVKNKVKVSQNFVAFSEYMNFKCHILVQFDLKGKQVIVTVSIFAFLGQINVLTKLITIPVSYINAGSRFRQNLQ